MEEEYLLEEPYGYSIIPPSEKMPRSLSQKMRNDSFYGSEIIEESESEEDEKHFPPTKIVIRHLPPNMKKEDFFGLLSLAPHDYKHFVQTDKESKENPYSTAYINFLNTEDAVLFLNKFDGHTFQNSIGEKYEAIVEFAPSQMVSKNINSEDSLCGTIDDDPDYLDFLKNLETETADFPNEENEVEKTTSKPTGALVDFVNKRRAEQYARGTYYKRRPYNRRWQQKSWHQQGNTSKYIGFNYTFRNPNVFIPDLGF